MRSAANKKNIPIFRTPVIFVKNDNKNTFIMQTTQENSNNCSHHTFPLTFILEIGKNIPMTMNQKMRTAVNKKVFQYSEYHF